MQCFIYYFIIFYYFPHVKYSYSIIYTSIKTQFHNPPMIQVAR